ncbi:MAG: hypothetical protein RLY93_05070 [Sumerlaeia bacterium]
MNSVLIEEVVEQFSALSFTGSRTLFTAGCQIVTTLDRAFNFAWNQRYGGRTWSEIKSEEMAVIRGELYKLEGSARFRAEGVKLDEMSRIIDRQLRGPLKEALDEILADYQGCMMSRYVFGKESPFFEKLFAAYRMGSWPCGWSGVFPEGRLIVFCEQEH